MNRRAILTGGAAAGLTAALPLRAKSQVRRPVVLVHGAWHGGWCWQRIVPQIEAAGHRVFAPSLTGLGDRSHLLSPAITLDTHITDIANLFLWEDIRDAVLVAHSYGGWPVTGALERIGDRVAGIAYLDAFVPVDGEAGIDLSSAKVREELRDAAARGEAGRPVPRAETFRIRAAADREWVQARMTPQPVGVSFQPIRTTGALQRIRRKLYLRANGYPQPRFDAYLSAAKADPTWQTNILAPESSGHDMMVDAPDLTAAALSAFAE